MWLGGEGLESFTGRAASGGVSQRWANSFIEETGQFHKVRFKEGAGRFHLPRSGLLALSRPSPDWEGTPWRPYRFPLMCVLPPAGCPSLLKPQGFRSSWGEEARRRADLRDPGPVGVTLIHRVGRFGPRDYRILVTPGPCPELCVLAQSNFPGGAGVHFPWPSILAREERGGKSDSRLRQEAKGAPTCSKPFSDAFLRGGQITASFPSPLLAAGEGALSRGCPSCHQLEAARAKETGRAP